MKLPEKMDVLSPENRSILGEFYNMNATKQWFERAELVINQDRRVLEIVVNYSPILEMKDILAFTTKYNLRLETIDLSHR
jgi:peroxiredoxin